VGFGYRVIECELTPLWGIPASTIECLAKKVLHDVRQALIPVVPTVLSLTLWRAYLCLSSKWLEHLHLELEKALLAREIKSVEF